MGFNPDINVIYVDADGVCVNFEKGYEDLTGKLLNKGEVDWAIIGDRKNFYRDLEPMPDMWELLHFVLPYEPFILTGIPSVETVPEAADNKKEWFRKHGVDVPVICTRSKTKSNYCLPGDILIDDWEKHKHLWVAKGGIWITHTSAKDTIEQLKRIL